MIGTQVAGFLIQTALQSTLLLCAGGLLSLAWRYSSAAQRHRIWTSTFLCLVLLPFVASIVPVQLVREFPRFEPWEWTASTKERPLSQRAEIEPSSGPSAAMLVATRAPSPSAELELASSGWKTPGDPRDASSASAVTHGPPPKPSVGGGSVIATLWVLGTVVLLVRLLLEAGHLRRLANTSATCIHAGTLQLVRDAAHRLALRRVPVVLLDAQSTMPMTWGLFRAHLLIPQDACTWPLPKLEAVVLHELAHIKHRDCLANFCGAAASALYWFHPLVWVARRRQRAECETAADDLVLSSGFPSADYAEIVLQVVSGRKPSSVAALAMGQAGVGSLERRLRRILDRSRHRSSVTKPVSIALTTAFGLGLLAAASLQATDHRNSGLDPATHETPSLIRPGADNAEPQPFAAQQASPDEPAIRESDVFAQAVAQQNGRVETQTSARRRAAVEAATAFLRQGQNADGSWRSGANQYSHGVTALCALALIKSAVPLDDAGLQRAFTVLRNADTKMTYELSLRICVLSHSEDEDDRRLVQQLGTRLAEAQVAQGDGAGSWSYGLTNARGGDGSNAHFAMLGLFAAHQTGADLGQDVFERAAGYWLAGQNADGSWGYQPRDGHGTGSMTSGGLCSLLAIQKVLGTGHADGAKVREAIGRSREWLAQHDSVETNPGSGTWLLYYLHARSRAEALSAQEDVRNSTWPPRVNTFLVEQQLGGGNWRGIGAMENDPSIATAFGLLILASIE